MAKRWDQFDRIKRGTRIWVGKDEGACTEGWAVWDGKRWVHPRARYTEPDMRFAMQYRFSDVAAARYRQMGYAEYTSRLDQMIGWYFIIEQLVATGVMEGA